MHEPEDKSRPAGDSDATYEKSDANANWIFGVVLGLAIFVVLAHYGVKWLQRRMAKAPATGDRWTAQHLASGGQVGPTNYPVLQIQPDVDLAALRAREERELNSFGWIDKTAGVAHIPIARAMDRVLQEGLPARSTSNPSGLGPSSYELQQQRPLGRQPEITAPR